MSWIRGNSLGHVALSNDVVAAVTGTSADTVDSIAAGGSGYVVGEFITLTGGTFTAATVLEVTSVSTGAVTGARIRNAGIYSVAPVDPVAQGSSSGAGTGATFNLTYSSNGWTADRDTTWSGSQREVILHGSGGGADTIYVGWRTYENGGAGRYNWELHGMTGFDNALGILNQVGISPGDHTSGTTSLQYGTYLPLSSSPLDWFLSVTPFRIILVVKVAGNYYSAYLGFLNRYATSTEYPYPLLVCGSSNWSDVVHSQSSEKISGLPDPWTHAGLNNQSPVLLLKPDGTWIPFANSTINGGSRNSASIVGSVLPCGTHSLITSGTNPPEDDFSVTSQTLTFGEFIEQGDLNPPNSNLEPTPGTVNSEYVLFPVMLARAEADGTATLIPGEVDDVFWFYAHGGVTSEDRIIKAGEVYRVFQNGNRTGAWEHLAVKEG